MLEPLLTADHDLIALAIEQIQTNMNTANGIGLAPMIPEVNTNRIDGLIKKVASGDLEQTRWVLGEPIINYSMSVVDEGIEANARATSKLGLKAYIIREAESTGVKSVKRGNKSYRYIVPCRWCADLAGKYDYEDVKDRGNDVYRKHEGCRCHITYINGTRQEDTWTHATWTEKDAHKRDQIIQAKADELAAQRSKADAQRKARAETVSEIASKLGYSERGASIWLNANKQYIERNGLDYMIDQQRNADALKKKQLKG